MAIYSAPIAELTQRVANNTPTKKRAPAAKSNPTAAAPSDATDDVNGAPAKPKRGRKAATAAAAVPPPPESSHNGDTALANETPAQRRSRLARERRARIKQEKEDAKAGVTLATGAVSFPVKDPSQPVFKTPKRKLAVGDGPAAAAKGVGAHAANGSTAPPAGNGPSAGETDVSGTGSAPTAAAHPTTSDASDVDEDSAATAAAAAAPAAKKTKRVKKDGKWPAANEEPSEPPAWYTRLLTEVIKTKLETHGEKASAKAIKTTGDEVAREQWSQPAERERVRANQDKLYNQMFGRFLQ